MKKQLILIILGMATISVAMSFTSRNADEGKLSLSVDHYVGDKILQFDTVTYKNEAGQSFTVSKFKYYIGNIHLEKENGEDVAFNDYYLVNEEEPDSKKIVLRHIPEGEYKGIEFIIGVDSLHNCGGSQSGALDPINDMFWAWNTGYVFLRLEGHAPASTSPGHIFEYHIGGYKQPYNCINAVSLSFRKPLFIKASATNDLHLKADIAEIFKNPVTIDLAQLSAVTDFHNSKTISDNYKDMFSVLSEN